MSTEPSIGIPSGHQATTCGYCSPPGVRTAARSSYHSAGLEAIQLSCKVYQGMIDRGWRRSGIRCYKPDLRYSCCPQYTIRLDALAFKPSKSQRKVVNRWNRYVLQGKDDETMDVDAGSKKTSSKSKNQTFSLTSAIHALETGFHTEEHSAHRFEVSLELSSFSQEKYALYRKYQEEIHHDPRESPYQFRSFLVDSPLTAEPIPYGSSPPSHLPKQYGSYHQLYRLDGELIAMAVLDILPNCVSSVYFIYDKKWEHFSFGKLSALREVALAREIREAGVSEMGYLYMGFYIHSCQKMRYKGDYSPSYLADPETYQWYPLKDCIPLMEKNRYACFSDPSRSIKGDAKPDDDSYPPVSDKVMESIRVKLTSDGRPLVLPLKLTNITKYKELRTEVEDCVQGLGLQASREVILTFEAS
ncbi:arginine-tRNA-protein transferase [Amanita rubescens]|nr:arginine-tRNA-protein transferase [Amanita rubescens]